MCLKDFAYISRAYFVLAFEVQAVCYAVLNIQSWHLRGAVQHLNKPNNKQTEKKHADKPWAKIPTNSSSIPG